MLKRLAALCVAMTFVLAPTAAFADDETGAPASEPTASQKVSPYIQSSIVAVGTKWSGKVYDKALKLYVRDAPFEAFSSCTGFALTDDGYVGTAGHCVGPQEDGNISVLSVALDWAYEHGVYGNVDYDTLLDHAAANWAVDGQKIGRADRAVFVGWGDNVADESNEDGLPARVISSQKPNAGDTALLKVEADGLMALPLADDAELETGTEIAAIGYPGSVDAVTDVDYTPSVKTGTVSSEKTVGGGLLKVYEIDAAVSAGMSGGPTVNTDGEVVGINSFGVEGETQPFNFIQPASNLSELLGGAGVDTELDEVSAAYRDGLTAFFDGDKDEAVDNLTLVTKERPDNAIAKEYLEKAQALPEPKSDDDGDSSGGLIAIVLIGVGVVIVIVIVAVVVIRRKNDKNNTPPPPAAFTGAVGPPPPPGSTTPYHQQ